MKHFVLLLLALASGSSYAFPPAPHHTVFGTVRDERGHPISVDARVTTLSGRT